MKKIISVLMAVSFVFVGLAMADPYHNTKITTTEEKEIESICPKTTIKGDVDDCLRCHLAPNFALKEEDMTKRFDPPYGADVLIRGEETLGYYLSSSPHPGSMQRAFEYFARNDKINRVIVEVHNPGGSVFDAWKCVSLIQGYANKFSIETHLRGMAFSAGFVIYNAAPVRKVAPHAQGMWHELMGFAFFETKTPAGLKDEAKEYAAIQYNINSFLSERTGGKVTVDEIHDKIYKKNWWMSGSEMLEMGFADELLED